MVRIELQGRGSRTRAKVPTIDGEAWVDWRDLQSPLAMSRFFTAECERALESDLPAEKKAICIGILTMLIEEVEPEQALDLLRAAMALVPDGTTLVRIQRLEERLRKNR